MEEATRNRYLEFIYSLRSVTSTVNSPYTVATFPITDLVVPVNEVSLPPRPDTRVFRDLLTRVIVRCERCQGGSPDLTLSHSFVAARVCHREAGGLIEK